MIDGDFLEVLQYKIDVFEGPLDLLLHLISKHKLDINDIPILQLVEQYIDYVRQMQDADMEIASEFLEMAARLVYIKTVSLLPVYEEAEQLKKELTGELMEYQQCKLIAKQLGEHSDGIDYFCRAPQPVEKDHRYTRLHEGEELFKAYLSAVGKAKRKLPPPVEAFTEIVSKKIVSVKTGISNIYKSLKKKSKKRFIEFFETAQSRSEMVATFLAILELVRARRVIVDGEGDDSRVDFGEADNFNELLDGEDFEY